MWRSFFLGLGIFICVLGVQSLFVEKVVLAQAVSPSAPILSADGTFTPPGKQREIQTGEWMPFSLIGLGVVTILYTITIPKRLQG